MEFLKIRFFEVCELSEATSLTPYFFNKKVNNFSKPEFTCVNEDFEK
jgi:hypothetical protein